ncbi:MAG: hypothetical protein ACP5NS_04970 [Candidatus Pacearchaeota archaeon]
MTSRELNNLVNEAKKEGILDSIEALQKENELAIKAEEWQKVAVTSLNIQILFNLLKAN